MGNRKVKNLLFSGIFLLGFVLGVLFVNLWGDTYLRETFFFAPDRFALIAKTDIETKLLFRHLIWRRGRAALLLWLLGYTVVALPVALLVLAAAGLMVGVLIGQCVASMKLAGVLLFLCAVLPQWAVYAGMLWKLLSDMYDRGAARFSRKAVFADKALEKQYLGTLFLSAALLILGTLLESSANLWLIRWAVKYFF